MAARRGAGGPDPDAWVLEFKPDLGEADVAGHEGEGNDELTGWCPKCETRALPNARDECMFCDTPLEGLQRPIDIAERPGPRVMALVGTGPRRRGEIDHLLEPMSRIEVSKLLDELMTRGDLVRYGNRGGARYGLPKYPPGHWTNWTEPKEEEVPVEIHADADGVRVEDAELGDPSKTPDGEPTPQQQELLRRLEANAAATAADIDELDEQLDGSSETILRARYLAALLKKIETAAPGETLDSLCDRFERLAGLT